MIQKIFYCKQIKPNQILLNDYEFIPYRFNYYSLKYYLNNKFEKLPTYIVRENTRKFIELPRLFSFIYEDRQLYDLINKIEITNPYFEEYLDIEKIGKYIDKLKSDKINLFDNININEFIKLFGHDEILDNYDKVLLTKLNNNIYCLCYPDVLRMYDYDLEDKKDLDFGEECDNKIFEYQLIKNNTFYKRIFQDTPVKYDELYNEYKKQIFELIKTPHIKKRKYLMRLIKYDEKTRKYTKYVNSIRDYTKDDKTILTILKERVLEFMKDKFNIDEKQIFIYNRYSFGSLNDFILETIDPYSYYDIFAHVINKIYSIEEIIYTLNTGTYKDHIFTYELRSEYIYEIHEALNNYFKNYDNNNNKAKDEFKKYTINDSETNYNMMLSDYKIMMYESLNTNISKLKKYIIENYKKKNYIIDDKLNIFLNSFLNIRLGNQKKYFFKNNNNIYINDLCGKYVINKYSLFYKDNIQNIINQLNNYQLGLDNNNNDWKKERYKKFKKESEKILEYLRMEDYDIKIKENENMRLKDMEIILKYLNNLKQNVKSFDARSSNISVNVDNYKTIINETIEKFRKTDKIEDMYKDNKLIDNDLRLNKLMNNYLMILYLDNKLNNKLNKNDEFTKKRYDYVDRNIEPMFLKLLHYLEDENKFTEIDKNDILLYLRHLKELILLALNEKYELNISKLSAYKQLSSIYWKYNLTDFIIRKMSVDYSNNVFVLGYFKKNPENIYYLELKPILNQNEIFWDVYRNYINNKDNKDNVERLYGDLMYKYTTDSFNYFIKVKALDFKKNKDIGLMMRYGTNYIMKYNYDYKKILKTISENKDKQYISQQFIPSKYLNYYLFNNEFIKFIKEKNIYEKYYIILDNFILFADPKWVGTNNEVIKDCIHDDKLDICGKYYFVAFWIPPSWHNKMLEIQKNSINKLVQFGDFTRLMKTSEFNHNVRFLTDYKELVNLHIQAKQFLNKNNYVSNRHIEIFTRNFTPNTFLHVHFKYYDTFYTKYNYRETEITFNHKTIKLLDVIQYIKYDQNYFKNNNDPLIMSIENIISSY
jgi:hypothetical protein